MVTRPYMLSHSSPRHFFTSSYSCPGSLCSSAHVLLAALQLPQLYSHLRVCELAVSPAYNTIPPPPQYLPCLILSNSAQVSTQWGQLRHNMKYNNYTHPHCPPTLLVHFFYTTLIIFQDTLLSTYLSKLLLIVSLLL